MPRDATQEPMTVETEVRELAETLYERDTGRALASAGEGARAEYRELALSILQVARVWGDDND